MEFKHTVSEFTEIQLHKYMKLDATLVTHNRNPLTSVII